MTLFRLRFPENQITKWAALYDYPDEPALIAGPVAAAKRRGHLLFEEFLQIAEWKSKRPKKRYRQNQPALVQEVTGIALASHTSPQLAIEVLTILSGVSWPLASVILHFCHRRPHPILDFRALWSLSCPVPSAYTYPFWAEYVEFTCSLSARTGHDMRTLDRALWQYSKVKQNGA